MNSKLNRNAALVTGDDVVDAVCSCSKASAVTLAASHDGMRVLLARHNQFSRGFAVTLVADGNSYNIAGYSSKDKKPSVDEIVNQAENYINTTLSNTPVYLPPKYATKDAEIAALRNALTLIKSLSTPPNLLPWEKFEMPVLPALLDKISSLAKEVL